MLITFGMGGALFLLTQYLQFVLGYGPLEAGLRTAPMALTVVVLNFTGVGTKWSAKMGTPPSIAVGMGLMAAGLVSIATLTGHGYGGTLLGLVLIGAGTAIGSPVMAHAVMSSVPREKAGVGAGINGTLAEFGNGLGVAVLGAVLNARFAALVPVAAASLPAALAAAGSTVNAPRSPGRSPPVWRRASWSARPRCCSAACLRRRCCTAPTAPTRAPRGNRRTPSMNRRRRVEEGAPW